MEFTLAKTSENAIKITNVKKFSNNELQQLFSQYGKIKKIVTEDDHRIICFSSEKAARRCIDDADRILTAFRGINFDFDSTGDKVCRNDSDENFSKIKKLFKQFTSVKAAQSESDKNIKPKMSSCNANPDFPTPACSLPVLLNTADPGFRLTYCHNVPDLKPDMKVKKLNSLNQTIKKYMDDTLPEGVQELVLTNLPKNIKKEDLYKICGQIEPATVELKTTANINILYAYIKLKSKKDFSVLNETLMNRYINGIKITAIPITKINETMRDSFSEIWSVHDKNNLN